MRTIRSIAAGLAALLALSAHAGEVYKCKDANGHVTFTNIRCPEQSEAQHYGSYRNTEDSPDQYSAAGDAAQEIRDRDAERLETAPSIRPSSGTRSTATSEPAGYQCSAHGRTWVQAAPCPTESSRKVSETVYVRGHLAGTGEPVNGTATRWRDDTVNVQQRGLSRDELCDQMKSGAKTAERGKGSDSTYERNKIRAANGCR